MMKLLFVPSDEPTDGEGALAKSPKLGADVVAAATSPSGQSSASDGSDSWSRVVTGSPQQAEEGKEEPAPTEPQPWERIEAQLKQAQSEAVKIQDANAAALATLTEQHAAQLATVTAENEAMRAQLATMYTLLQGQIKTMSAAADSIQEGAPAPKASSGWVWRLLCPGWFRPRQALSNTRLGKSLASYNLADKAHALALGRTTKLGWALRSVVAAGALYATGHYVRVHRHVLLGLLYAARARAVPLARPFVAVSGMLTKKVLAVLAVAAVGSACLYFQQAVATDGDGDEHASSSQALEKLRDLYTKSGADTAIETICARPTTKLGWGTRVVAAALVLYLARRYGAAPAMRMITAARDKLPALPVVSLSISRAAAEL